MADPIDEYRLTVHAMLQMERRGIVESDVRRILSEPEQRYMIRSGRDVLQSRIVINGKTYLIRVFVDVSGDTAEVVTAYRTSNIAKYWRSGS